MAYEQLALLDELPPGSHLDPRTRAVGRQGVAQVRALLAERQAAKAAQHEHPRRERSAA